MVEITNREELEKWLKGRDREVMRAITSRVALRVLPLIVGAGRLKSLYALSWTLFRATAASEAGSAAVAESAASAADAAYADASNSVTGNAEATSFDAIYAAAASASSAYDDYAPCEHIVDAITPISSFLNASTWSFGGINEDIQFLNQNGDPRMLMAQPLWIRRRPDHITNDWALLKAALLQDPDLHWDVWVDWYEARLTGGPRNWDLEQAWSQVPYEEGLWHDAEDPTSEQIRRLNLCLKTLKIKYDAHWPEKEHAPSGNVPGDNLAGRGFAQNKETGRIAASALPKEATATDLEAYMLHGDVDKALETLENMLSPDARLNRCHDDLLSKVHGIRDAMGANPTEVLPRPFIHRAAAMDDALELDDAAKRDPDSMERPCLSTEERRAVKKAASAIAIYVQTDPFLSNLTKLTHRAATPVGTATIETVDGFATGGAIDSATHDDAITDKLEVAPESIGFASTLNFIKMVVRAKEYPSVLIVFSIFIASIVGSDLGFIVGFISISFLKNYVGSKDAS